jgi:ABC-type antimicrobial peptide transport system permease subunit
LLGGLLGVVLAVGLLHLIARSSAIGVPGSMKFTFPIAGLALTVAALVGLMSAVIPSYNASRQNIVDGLRHIG